MKIHEYNEMMRHLTRREPNKNPMADMETYDQGGRVGYQGGQLVDHGPGRQGYAGDSVKEFTMKKEKYITKNGKVAYKPLDVVANTPEAKKKLANFAKEYRRFKSFPPTSAAAKQAGVLGTRDLYNKYFKNSFEYDTYNKSLLSIFKKKYSGSKANPLKASDVKFDVTNPGINEKQAKRLRKRYDLDPKRLKESARKLAGRTGDLSVGMHHGLGLNTETLGTLIADEDFAGAKGTTKSTTAERALRSFENQIDELKLNKPAEWQRKSDELMAKLNRLKKGKEVEYSFISNKGNRIDRKVKFTPQQMGLYGFKADTSTGYKGLDKSKTVAFKAGISDELANKPFSQLNKAEQKKATNAIAKVLTNDNIKSNKIIPKATEPLLISGEQTLTPDGYRFTGIDYDKPSRVAQLLNQGISKTPKPVGSALKVAGKLATGAGRFIFDPFLFPSIPVEMMIAGAAGFEKNKKELKKALKDAPIVSQMAKAYNMDAEEVRNAIFEKYREAALANETGLEEQMAFVPAHQKDVEKFDKNFFPFWDPESYEGKPHADTSYVKKEPFKQMIGDTLLGVRAEDEEAERKLRSGEVGGTQFYKKPTYYTKKDYYPDDFSDKTLAGQLKSKKKIRFENLRGLEDPLPAGFFKGGRVSFKFGGKGVDKGRRAFMKLLAALGIGTATVGTGLIKLGGKAVGKKAAVTAGADIVAGTQGMPSWFPALVNKIVKEGDDVTAKLATQERQVVHTKKIDTGSASPDDVTIYRDLDTGDIRVEYNSVSNMGEGAVGPVQMEYKAGQVIDEGKMAGKKTDPEFSAAEPEPVGHVQGQDDYVIEWDGDNIVGNVDDLISDTSKLKNYAKSEKPTMKDIVTRKRKTDEVNAIHKNESDYIVSKQGEGEWDDYLPDIDDID